MEINGPLALRKLMVLKDELEMAEGRVQIWDHSLLSLRLGWQLCRGKMSSLKGSLSY